MMSTPLGIYIHIPFCSIRCSYCDFPTVAGADDRIDPYLAALTREIADFQPDLPTAVDTVFFGGGTPSRLAPARIAGLVDLLRHRFDLASDAEITIEANPETLDVGCLEGYRGAGITRVSVGVQSLDDGVLARTGRAHDAARAQRAVREVREVGFEDLSVDLICGLPGEDLAGWERTLMRIVEMEPDHISVYLLESDKDTPLARGIRSGRVAAPDDDALAEAYETTAASLERAGYDGYEISNFARAGHRSRHNLKYWTDAPFAGFGNGAHGYVHGERRSNRRDLHAYLADVAAGRSPVERREPWEARRRLEEALFLGLRLREGVDLFDLERRYGIDPWTTWGDAWTRASDAEILERDGTRVRLTPRGRLRSNELFAEFLT